MTPSRRSTDASRLSFPLQLVIVIVSVAITILSTTYGLRGEVSNIRTEIKMQREAEADQAKLRDDRDAVRAKLQEERDGTIQKAIEDMKRRQELQQYEIQGLKEAVLKLGVKP